MKKLIYKLKLLICKIFGCKIRKIELFKGYTYYICLRCDKQCEKEPKNKRIK